MSAAVDKTVVKQPLLLLVLKRTMGSRFETTSTFAPKGELKDEEEEVEKRNIPGRQLTDFATLCWLLTAAFQGRQLKRLLVIFLCNYMPEIGRILSLVVVVGQKGISSSLESDE